MSKYYGTVTASALNVRSSPTTSSKKIASLKKGEHISISETQSGADGKLWGHMPGGWVCLKSGRSQYVSYKEENGTTSINAAQTSGGTGGTTSGGGASSTSGSSSSSSNNTTSSTSTNDPTKHGEGTALSSAFASAMINSTNGGSVYKKSMRLFGLPYQFRPEVDFRVPQISKVVGRKFINSIIQSAAIITIIPGRPKYLPNAKNKEGISHALIEAANEGFTDLQHLLGNSKDNPVKYYDFESSYAEYMNYVNILCRTAATFLELKETIDGQPLQSYDWKNYRWTGDSYSSATKNLLKGSANIAKGVVNKVKEFGQDAITMLTSIGKKKDDKNNGNKLKLETDDVTAKDAGAKEALYSMSSFVEFFIDTDFGANESINNSSAESSISGIFKTGSDVMKEFAFITNSGGIEQGTEFQEWSGNALKTLSDKMSSGGSISSFFKRFLDVSGNIIKGENIIVPKIYTGSEFSRGQTPINVTLKAIYGDRFSYFMDVMVPLFHLLCLALPKQTSANSYGAPFLVKYLCPGVANCNLGLVTSLTVDKGNAGVGWTVDGFPNEIKVSMIIEDLYSDMAMSPSNQPRLFLANSSLIDYLASTCGLNIIQPQLANRAAMTINATKNAFGDIKTNVVTHIDEKIDHFMAGWTSISGR